MFYKFIELSRSLIRCSTKCQKYSDGTSLIKDVIAKTIAQHRSKTQLRYFFINISENEVHKVLPFFNKRSILILITKELKQMQGVLKENTIKITKSCLSQFEFVVAHRVRRAQQVFSLYSKLWDDKALKVMITRLRKQFMLRGRAFMMGLTAAAVINWDEEKIAEEELLRHSRELDMCHRLKNSNNNKKEKKKEDSLPCLACDSVEEDDCWEPFVATGDLTCWKRESPNRKGSGLYCYKMYGAYNDVSANDFLEAFLDIKERKAWDSHVVDLHIISSDPSSNSDLIYWETKWPSLFSNRDYVFKRRYKILDKEKIIVVCNKSSSHPDYPVYSSKTRVTQYWSYLVIKPFTQFSEPGIEFSLTYFDDPGTSLPSAISSWASTTGMPEFMKKLRFAARKMADLRASLGLMPIIPDVKSMTSPVDDEEDECELVSEDELYRTSFFDKFPYFNPPRSFYQYFPYFPLK